MSTLKLPPAKIRVRRQGRNEARQKPGWQVPASLAEAVRTAVAEAVMAYRGPISRWDIFWADLEFPGRE